jgi:hypothetical protein
MVLQLSGSCEVQPSYKHNKVRMIECACSTNVYAASDWIGLSPTSCLPAD